MINFQYARPNDVSDAVRMIAGDPTAKFIAGGTNLIDLMKEDVERPSRLIDISRLPLGKIEETADGGVRIGALVPNSDLAWHPVIEQRYPLLRSAIMAGASQQLRNMASTGGNLLQRTLRLFLRHCDVVQQARAGQRLLSHRRRQPHSRNSWYERVLHRHASFRHVRGACRAGCKGAGDGALRRTRAGVRGFPSTAGIHARDGYQPASPRNRHRR